MIPEPAQSGNSARFAAVPLDEPGTPTHEWQAAAQSLPPLDITDLDHVLLVVAHPDDECLGTGGLIHTLTARGTPVSVVIVSGGQQSHAHGPSVDPLELSAIRQAESVAAARIMGTDTPVFLGYPDGDLRAHSDAIARDLRDVIERAVGENNGTPPVLVTHWRGDGHPDHETVGLAAAQAAESLLTGDQSLALLEFPLWALHWDSPYNGQFPLPHAAVGPAGSLGLLRKRQAVSCFISQVLPWPASASAPVMPEHVVDRLLEAPELFLFTWLGVPDPIAGDRQEPVDGLDHLEALYGQAQDPWDLETSDYEKAKRQATLGALPRQRYGLCFEVGSSIGVLSAELAQRADHVVGWEPVERAAQRARARITELEAAGALRAGSVRIENRALSALTGELGPAGADLIVLSEVLYFIPHQELAPIISGLCAQAAPGAHVVAVHWKHPVTGWPEGGAGTHRVLAEEPSLRPLHSDDSSDDYLLEVFEVRR